MKYNYVRNVSVSLMVCSLLIIAFINFDVMPVFASCDVEITDFGMYVHYWQGGPAVNEGYTTWTITIYAEGHNNGEDTSANLTAYYDDGGWIEIGSTEYLYFDSGETYYAWIDWDLEGLTPGDYPVKVELVAACGDNDTESSQMSIRPWGDVDDNGSINVGDMLNLKVVLILEESLYSNPFCDINGNGKISIVDVLYLKVIISLGTTGTGEAEDTAVIYVDPSTSQVTVNEVFSVNVCVANVTDLAAFEFELFSITPS